MTIYPSRRAFLGLSGATLVALSAGCLDAFASDPATLNIKNSAAVDHTVTVSAVHRTGEQADFEASFTLTAGDVQQVPNPLQMAGTYDIRVVVADTYDETYEWTISENGARSLYLDIQSDGMSFSDADWGQ
ncbi:MULTISPECIES: FixH family protein [unclassified Haladaptatus]|uniref:FixH family protein n=1 Tax=unclassified Haladaptatus TaxID=2622732 RepID=UPI0023E853C2|nr:MULTISPECIES: FixH family protein [unclassified Haladaptatus]